MKYITTVNETQYTIEIDQENRVKINGERYELDLQQLEASGLISLLLNNQSFEAMVESGKESHEVLVRGEHHTVVVHDEHTYHMSLAREASGGVTGEITIKSPMPGVILQVLVKEGDVISKGMTVAILESMKMENELKSPRDGLIKRTSVQPGTAVEKNQPLIIIGDPEE